MFLPMNSHPNPASGLQRGHDLTVPALVLRITPYRDSDLMAHLLTPSLGKISTIARHARGSRKRFPSSLDLFDRGNARLTVEKSGAVGIKEFAPSHSLKRVRDDLDKLTLASLMCEAFDLILQEDGGDSGSPEIFEILDLSLNALDEATGAKDCLRATYIALTSLTKRAGIVDLTSTPPSSRALTHLMRSIEVFCERPLMTRSTLDALFSKAARENQKNGC
jgi:recombinational DNA repair protein (RecF pathway)